MDNISQKIQDAAKDWNIDAIVKAVIADDPDMAEHAEDFRESLIQIKTGNLKNARVTKIPLSPITETRHAVQLS
ncbi:hypothetical protein [Rodentibacter heidelbergensis]|uniref:hypothetical protein n=1 Tax=Rodentibacter heidelbergensis TaxID=1908258 RepID=UPI001ABEFEAE|nr:hypothetical protein [Rodentibacter heidelbergensis]